jgi:hypothetical protein
MLETTREKYQFISIAADLSEETLKAMETWNDIFQALKVNYCQQRLLHPTMVTFKIDGDRKTFQDKHKLKQS